jgi:hypothetical protein
LQASPAGQAPQYGKQRIHGARGIARGGTFQFGKRAERHGEYLYEI